GTYVMASSLRLDAVPPLADRFRDNHPSTDVRASARPVRRRRAAGGPERDQRPVAGQDDRAEDRSSHRRRSAPGGRAHRDVATAAARAAAALPRTHGVEAAPAPVDPPAVLSAARPTGRPAPGVGTVLTEPGRRDDARASGRRRPRPRHSSSVRRQRQRGQSVVEFALVTPLFLLLVLGTIDFGVMFEQAISITE